MYTVVISNQLCTMTSLKTSEYFMGWEQSDNMIVVRISLKALKWWRL